MLSIQKTPSAEWITNVVSKTTGKEDNVATYTDIFGNFLPEFPFYLTSLPYASLCGGLTFFVFSWKLSQKFSPNVSLYFLCFVFLFPGL